MKLGDPRVPNTGVLARRANNVVETVYSLIDRAPFIGKGTIQPALHEAYGTANLVQRRAAQEKAVRAINSLRNLNAITALGSAQFVVLGAHDGPTGKVALAFLVAWAGAHAACAVRQHALVGRLKERMVREEAKPPDWDQDQPVRSMPQMSSLEKYTGIAITLGGTALLVLCAAASAAVPS